MSEKNRLNMQQLLGVIDTHIVAEGEYCGMLHQQVVKPFEQMRRDALTMGVDIAIASGYRSFQRQLAIWNGKACGERALLDDRCRPVDVNTLSEQQAIDTILRWSALPGMSRHHWGTDFDVYDRAIEHRVQLEPDEYEQDGPYARMVQWLDQHMEGYGFYRPYRQDLGGVAPEPWHLSFAPLALQYMQVDWENLLYEQLLNTDIHFKAKILASLANIVQRYSQVSEP